MKNVAPRIAIPEPHSQRPDYVERSLPQYERAVEQAGGIPLRIPLDQEPAQVMKLIERCNAVLLPGSAADIDPAKYHAPRHPRTAPPDPRRDMVDELLLQDAYNMRKPILGICYGLQSLNVYCSGTLAQDIGAQLNSDVRHHAGRQVHRVRVEPVSTLAAILGSALSKDSASPDTLEMSVNSSHHQAVEVLGDGLRRAAWCPDDNVLEAVEGTSPGHFVLAVQWHPERSLGEAASQSIFRALVEAAQVRQEALSGEFESL